MAALKWDEVGKRLYETGTDKGVLYLQDTTGKYPLGVPWNGLIGVTESPSGAEANKFYANNIPYLNILSAEEFGGTITAYTYPDEFEVCNGVAEIAKGVGIGQQTRKPFGMAYRSLVGNDTEQDDHGYKIHLIYNGTVAPSEKDYKTKGESPEPIEMSWELTTIPTAVPGFKPTAQLIINSLTVDEAKLKILEDKLYGAAETEATLPSPEEVMQIFAAG